MIVLETVFLVVFWSWAISALLFLRNTVLPRVPLSVLPAHLRLAADTVHFRATDGVSLEGWKIPGQPNRPWIILCHGVGSNRSDLLEIGAGLHQEGFNLFLFDFRGHGGSAGRVTSFGWQEQRDLEGALAFLGQQVDVPANAYGVYGISLGGAVALMVAARDERLGAVAVDSPYDNLEASLRHHLKLLYPMLPRIPFHWFVLSAYRLRFGVWPRRLSPEACASTLSLRPLLLIQGAGYLEGYALNPQAYLARLIRFFDKG